MFRDVKKMKAGKKLLVIPILAAACLFPSSAGGGEKSTVEAAVVENAYSGRNRGRRYT